MKSLSWVLTAVKDYFLSKYTPSHFIKGRLGRRSCPARDASGVDCYAQSRDRDCARDHSTSSLPQLIVAPMSSPPQLQLSLPPNTTSFKRSFEQFGFDLESPASTLPHSHEPIDGTSSTASSSSSSTRSPDGDDNRRKRARSASSLSEPEGRSSDASSSTLSSFDSENASDSFSHSSSSQAARRHLLLDLGLGRGLGSSVALGLGMAAAELQLGGRGSSEPPPRIPTPELLESEDVDMPDIDMDFSRHEEPEEEPVSPAEHVRRSVDRFNAFDRHISVLRSSSPPVIPLPTSLSSRQASLSPPTLPPLPLVDLGLDPEDDEDGDEPGMYNCITNLDQI
jgi:hypothetical protein